MATAINIPPITIEQYLGFESPEGYRDELINGKIIVSPQPKPLHQQIVENIKQLMDSILQDQRYGAHLNSNIKFAEANSMPAPDVFVVADDVWDRACEEDEYLDCVPLVAVEVISPSNRKKVVEEKTALYIRQGVAQVWVVYPKQEELEIVTQEGRSGMLSGSYTIALPQPLEGSVTVSDVFSRRRKR